MASGNRRFWITQEPTRRTCWPGPGLKALGSSFRSGSPPSSRVPMNAEAKHQKRWGPGWWNVFYLLYHSIFDQTGGHAKLKSSNPLMKPARAQALQRFMTSGIVS